MQKINIAFFPSQKNISVLEHLRVVGPVSYTDMNLIICHKNMDGLLENLENAQLIVIQRNFSVDYDFYSFLVEFSRKQNMPIVYDLDDNLFDLPREHPDRQSNAFANALMPMLDAALSADYLTVSNNYLKNSLSDLNQNIYVLPNYLDERIWQFKFPKTNNPDQYLTLGYMGSASHKPDIEFVANTLTNIKQEFSGKIRFLFYGVKPPEVLLSYPDTIWTPIKTYQYAEFAQDFQQVNVDFFIAPLIDNNFNRCKSPIKFFEYSSIGVPGIFSRLYPYDEIIIERKNGLLADSLEEWDEKIRLMIQSPELRQNMAANAQNLIKEKYLMSQKATQWEEIYKNFINWGISVKPQRKASAELIKKITPQLLELHSNNKEKVRKLSTNFDQIKIEHDTLQNRTSDLEKKVVKLQNFTASIQKEKTELQKEKTELQKEKTELQKEKTELQNTNASLEKKITKSQNKIDSFKREIKSLKNIIDSFEIERITFQDRINTLEQEILFYALSKSWRITRPMRKFKKFITRK
jgi:glycosyltransferase involved in cell wall biosynthesis